MNDNGRIGLMKKEGENGRSPRKHTYTVFVYQKVNMAQLGIEPMTPTSKASLRDQSIFLNII